MDEKLETAEKKVLVEIVKLVQKRGLEGTKGGWKDFLNTYDKQLGASLSDPSRRSNDVLVSFLKTFTKEEDLKFFSRVLQSHLNRNIVEQFRKQSRDNESPEQSLVRLTLEHPQYPLEYTFPTGDEEWIVTKLPKKSRATASNAMLAVDCEMVLCEDGTEALVKVCVVDRDLQVKIDELVNPNKAVADYRTEITGIAAGDLDGVTCSVADIQSVLGYEVREAGAAHNCLDDACAAMKLVLAKLERGEIAVDKDVPHPETEKLLLHKIPINIRREEISKVIPGAVAIEAKPSKKLQYRHYSAFAVFNSPQEANQAYENMEGDEEKDLYGLPQKLVRFQFGEGVTASMYIRKMARDDSHREVLSNKRAIEGEEKPVESKKPRTADEKIAEGKTRENPNQLDDHLIEIERLKQEMKEKDARIALQDKMISNLLKKVDEMKKVVSKKK